MSPQRSNRAQLIEGTLRCLENLPPERITVRAIAQESGANIASVTYHFGSKENLVAEAAVAGLDRWLEETADRLGDLSNQPAAVRLQRAAEVIEESRRKRVGLVRNYVAALARAQHDERIRQILAEGFWHSRPNVAALLGLGTGQAALDAAGLVLSMLHGLLIQVLLDPDLAIEGKRMKQAQSRLRKALPA